ncbi:MAG: hypothetical protein M1370_01880, partial [Bacteroidetes bacterium]|nr:hypothetical protein [Bacteroidota bacterium]
MQSWQYLVARWVGEDDPKVQLVGRSAREVPFPGVSTQVGSGNDSILEHGDVSAAEGSPPS